VHNQLFAQLGHDRAACAGDSVYSRLMTAIGRPDMAADNPQFATNNDRCKHVDLIMSEISKYCAQHTIGACLPALSAFRYAHMCARESASRARVCEKFWSMGVVV